MPLTFPTHPAAVIPLKLRWPRRFDGVALVLGSAAPDIAYAADGYGVTIHSHAWHAPLWWALPITLVAARLTRWAAPTVAAHLPTAGPLALRDYGTLASVRHPWLVTAYSAVLGAASHIVWDAFTHPYVDGGRLLLPVLHDHAFGTLPWWRLLSSVSDLIGIAAGLALAVGLGRARLLRTWHGDPPATERRPTRFWLAAGAVLAIGLALLPMQPAQFLPDQAIRCLLAAGAALLAGTAAARTRAVSEHPGTARSGRQSSPAGWQHTASSSSGREPPSQAPGYLTAQERGASRVPPRHRDDRGR